MTRRSVQEILTRYELEPELRGDIYVEGEFDATILRWFAAALRLDRCVVYTIDTVEVDESIAVALGLDSGSNRSRLVALAQELNEKHPDIHSRILCIIDRDFDSMEAAACTYPAPVAVTEHSCMECYFLGDAALEKFARFCAGADAVGPNALAERLFATLLPLFVARYCLKVRGYGRDMMKVERSLSLDGNGLMVLDWTGYLDKLATSRAGRDAAPFKANVIQLLGSLQPGRDYVNGHDLSRLLHWYANKRRARAFSTPDAAITSLLMAAEPGALTETTLFSRVVSVAKG